MKQFNIKNIIPNATVLNQTINSTPLQCWNVVMFSIQIVFTGTPTGTFKLQASDDPATGALASGDYTGNATTAPSHWTDVADSTFTVSAAGNVMWNYESPGYNWVRVVYTDTSSGASTAIVTVSTMNGKGF